MSTTVAIKVQYDGHGFEGFQRQAGAPTIQKAIETGISLLTGEKISVVGSGRTDAGVHAIGQVISFRTDSRIPPEKWAAALNTKLPSDVRAISSCKAPEGFNARYDAISKTYCYTILPQTKEHALMNRYAWVTEENPDLRLLQISSLELIGEHNFEAFRSAGSRQGSALRRMIEIKVAETELEHLGIRVINARFTANGFLYKMVRNIMGAMMEVATGKQSPTGYMTRLLLGKDRRIAPPPAPASGLYLVEVLYPEGLLVL